jgi:hypothetical protein
LLGPPYQNGENLLPSYLREDINLVKGLRKRSRSLTLH